MSFSRENQMLTSGSFLPFSRCQSVEKDLFLHSKEDYRLEEEILYKKRKLLEEKAPGLFDYLTRLTGEETTTETGSSPSRDHDSEDSKSFFHSILIPTPIKPQNSIISQNVTLSNVVKINAQNTSGDMLPHVSPGSDWFSQERPEKKELDKQRQHIMQLDYSNQMMLDGISKQTDMLFKMAYKCLEDVKNFKKCNEKQETPLQRMEQIKGEIRHISNPSSENLFEHIFGGPNPYKYELVIDCELPQPIFRERNIIIRAKLVDILTREPVKNVNKILIQLMMQTWEVPSNPILRNKTGNKAIMGETEVELKNGEVIFDHIQINEVTSKFIHGHVALLIIPCKPVNHGTSLTDHEHNEGYLHFEQIKPLMLEKIVVKSKKKTKKKAEESQ